MQVKSKAVILFDLHWVCVWEYYFKEKFDKQVYSIFYNNFLCFAAFLVVRGTKLK